LAEQAVAAALAYRAQSPIIDGLLKELGMSGGSLAGLTQAAVPQEAHGSPREAHGSHDLPAKKPD
jgi:hypothetical protein